mgnify:FL=1
MVRIHERPIQLRLDFFVFEKQGYKQNTQNLYVNSNYYHLQEDSIGLICTQA